MPKVAPRLLMDNLSAFLKPKSEAVKDKISQLIKKMKSRLNEVLNFVNSLPKKLTSVFFENVYGVWIVRSWASVIGYILFFSLSLFSIITFDLFSYTRQYIHSTGANEAVIGAITIMLALLIPVAIALIDDARESALARQTIVKSIIRFNLAPLVLVIVCAFFFIPAGIHIFGESVTLKNGYAAVLACCVLFILTSFYRSYKWLSDGSAYSSGSPEIPPDGEPQPEAFFSYRFARIVRLLSGAKGYETWMTIWSQWFPSDYEDVLHAAFFKRELAVLKNKKSKRYIILSLELEAYDKYFQKRNVNSWRFELEHSKQSLLLYADIESLVNTDRRLARAEGLWRGKAALERIDSKVIDTMMTRQRSWNLFEFMEEYVKKKRLLVPIKSRQNRHDFLIKTFLQKYFNAVIDDRVNTYELEGYFEPSKPWAITYGNLYTHRYTLTFIVADEFKEWLFKKLDDLSVDDSIYEADTLISDLFPEADPITMGRLFWMLHQAKNSVDSNVVVEAGYKGKRPIGHIGRSTSFWVEEEEAHMKNFAKFQAEQEDNAIKLFATMYASFFRNVWNLNDIIKTAKAIDTSTIDEFDVGDLKSFIRLMEKIRKFYRTLDKENKHDK